MPERISAIAPPGSLLKGAKPQKTRKQLKASRGKDLSYLDKVRKLPCLGCDCGMAGVAAHVRMNGGPGKQQAMGKKPPDSWTLPLCQTCHERQHSIGEKPFWKALGLDPLALCLKLHLARGSARDMANVIHQARALRR